MVLDRQMIDVPHDHRCGSLGRLSAFPLVRRPPKRDGDGSNHPFEAALCSFDQDVRTEPDDGLPVLGNDRQTRQFDWRLHRTHVFAAHRTPARVQEA